MQDLLKSFPLIIDIPLAWGEMDAFQHVNNIVYFRYFESARMAYFDKLKLWQYMEETGIGPILASTQCKFKLPLTYPDTVSVGTRIAKIEDDHFLMEYVVVSHRHQKIAAKGESVVVCYNYRDKKKTPISAELKQHTLEEFNQGS